MSLKVVTIVGNRPQFVKASALSPVLASQRVKEIIVHTGQHYDRNLSQVFFEELEIPEPSYNLGIGSGSHGVQTGKMLQAIEEVLLVEKPDWVVVFGDTNTTIAGSLAAVKQHIRVAHVESGLRSFNMKMPEEVNRIVTDRISELLLAPSELAVENLKREGISQDKIHFVGDIMYDAFIRHADKALLKSQIINQMELKPKGYILATVHRPENTDNSSRLLAIFSGLIEVAQKIPIVFPMHPRTRKAMKNLPPLSTTNLKIIEPVGYLDMTTLEKNAMVIVTDAAGIQPEAFYHRVPCVTLRNETEWMKLIEIGWNRLVPPVDKDIITSSIMDALKHKCDEDFPGDIFGNGTAAEQTVSLLTA